jgi:hypothetical protein
MFLSWIPSMQSINSDWLLYGKLHLQYSLGFCLSLEESDQRAAYCLCMYNKDERKIPILFIATTQWLIPPHPPCSCNHYLNSLVTWWNSAMEELEHHIHIKIKKIYRKESGWHRLRLVQSRLKINRDLTKKYKWKWLKLLLKWFLALKLALVTKKHYCLWFSGHSYSKGPGECKSALVNGS